MPPPELLYNPEPLMAMLPAMPLPITAYFPQYYKLTPTVRRDLNVCITLSELCFHSSIELAALLLTDLDTGIDYVPQYVIQYTGTLLNTVRFYDLQPEWKHIATTVYGRHYRDYGIAICRQTRNAINHGPLQPITNFTRVTADSPEMIALYEYIHGLTKDLKTLYLSKLAHTSH